jgi:hypothetical protein
MQRIKVLENEHTTIRSGERQIRQLGCQLAGPLNNGKAAKQILFGKKTTLSLIGRPSGKQDPGNDPAIFRQPHPRRLITIASPFDQQFFDLIKTIPRESFLPDLVRTISLN